MTILMSMISVHKFGVNIVLLCPMCPAVVEGVRAEVGSMFFIRAMVVARSGRGERSEPHRRPS
jgi:hypothetical protein